MPKTPPEGFARITPYVYYKDVGTALDWLAGAFGFTEVTRMKSEDGIVNHAEMSYEGQAMMFGHPGADYEPPAKSGHRGGLIHVYVDDVDKHFLRAQEAGAKIIQEPVDQFYGDREYGAEDLEGHHWYFATHVKDVAPEDMKPQT